MSILYRLYDLYRIDKKSFESTVSKKKAIIRLLASKYYGVGSSIILMK